MENKEYFNVTISKDKIKELFVKHGFKYSILLLEEELQHLVDDWVHDKTTD